MDVVANAVATQSMASLLDIAGTELPIFIFTCLGIAAVRANPTSCSLAMRQRQEDPAAQVSAAPAEITAYNCMLEACVAQGNFPGAARLLERMQGKGRVDVISYNTFLKSVLQRKVAGSSYRTMDAVAKVLQQMRSQGIRPNTITYNSLINAAVCCGKLASAWKFLTEMEEEGVALDSFTCSTLMKGVKQGSMSPEDVNRVLALIARSGLQPDVVLINNFLEACIWFGGDRGIQLLGNVFEQFRSLSVELPWHSYVMLIKHARQFKQVQMVWHELTVERKIVPSDEIFSCMIEACLGNGELGCALQVFREMKFALPTSSSKGPMFSALIKTCIQRSQNGLAMELYEEMEQDASVSIPLLCYNTLLAAFCRAGDITAVATLFLGMGKRGVEPDLITYSTIIKCYCARGEMEQAIRMVSFMRSRGIEPDAVLFNSVLDGCAHKQMRELTEKVLLDMAGMGGCPPSNFTLSILIKLYSRCHDLPKAAEVVKDFPRRYGFTLNAQVYTCLMSACISNDQLGEALSVFHEMQAAGCVADAKTYQTLLTGCLKRNDLDSAVGLIHAALGPAGCGRRISLDSAVAEMVLLAAIGQGRGSDLGAALAERLSLAGITVSAAVWIAVRRSCHDGIMDGSLTRSSWAGPALVSAAA